MGDQDKLGTGQRDTRDVATGWLQDVWGYQIGVDTDQLSLLYCVYKSSMTKLSSMVKQCVIARGWDEEDCS